MAWWINNAHDDDLEALHALSKKALFPPWTLSMLMRELDLPQSRFRVLRFRDPFSATEEQIGGFCVSWVVADELHLLLIVVDVLHRQKGFGHRLLQDAIEMAREEHLQQIILEVRASNNVALQLYRKYNFREVGIRRDYYGYPTEDAIVLIKEDLFPSLLHTGPIP